MDKSIIGSCPLCGGNVVKTSKGYKCENNTGESPKCTFFINGLVGNRRMSDQEISLFLQDKEILLDGFATKEGKTFTTILRFSLDGKISMDSTVGKCPNCGGDIRVNSRAYGCANYHHPERPCGFTVWRNVAGHNISLAEIRELLSNGAFSSPVEMFNEEGNKFSKVIALSDDRQKIIFQ